MNYSEIGVSGTSPNQSPFGAAKRNPSFIFAVGVFGIEIEAKESPEKLCWLPVVAKSPLLKKVAPPIDCWKNEQ